VNNRIFHGAKGRKAGNFTAICEPIFQKMWEPRRFTTLWTSTTCCSDIITFLTGNTEVNFMNIKITVEAEAAVGL
jgi:hypothetical protein